MPPTKAHIRASFDGAAQSYDSVALAQRRICGRLALGLPAVMTPGVILDAGCGTGFGLRLLHERFPAANLIGLDVSLPMLAVNRPPCHRLAGDVEALPLADQSIGLYWSSLTLQWCRLQTALAEARRVLWEGGRIAIATLGPETYTELRTAFAAAGHDRQPLNFLAPEAVESAAAGFSELRLGREREVAHYADLKRLLSAIRAIGANPPGPGRRAGLMGRDAWQRVESAYEALRQPAGLPLTYDVIIVHGKKGVRKSVWAP